MNDFTFDPVDMTGPQQGLGFELGLAEEVPESIDESKLLDLVIYAIEEEFDYEF